MEWIGLDWNGNMVRVHPFSEYADHGGWNGRPLAPWDYSWAEYFWTRGERRGEERGMPRGLFRRILGEGVGMGMGGVVEGMGMGGVDGGIRQSN